MAQLHAVLPTNTIIHGRYRILGPIASGGMGGVYRAVDTAVADREVALKYIEIPPCTPAERPKWIKLIQTEAQTLSDLHHTAVPIIYDFFTEGHAFCIVMNLIPGQTLKDWLAKKLRAKSGKPGIDDVIQLVTQVCHVIEYLHAHTPPVLFRDMKPANVILRPDGTFCLIDFGISGRRRTTGSQATQDVTMSIGSPGYAAPEQWSELAQSDVTTDVYGLGAMLHELLTGEDPEKRAPFIYPKPSKLRKGIASELDTIVMKCLEPDQEERWPTVKEFREALEGYLGQRTPATLSVPTSNTGAQLTQDVVTLLKSTVLPNYHHDAFRRLLNYYASGLLKEAAHEADRLRKTLCSKYASSDEIKVRDEIWFVLGAIREAQGKLRAAEYCYKKSIEADPQRALAYQALARVKNAPAVSKAQKTAAAAKRQQQITQQRQQAAQNRRSVYTKIWQVVCSQLSIPRAVELLSGPHSFLIPTAITAGILHGYRNTASAALESFDLWTYLSVIVMIFLGWGFGACLCATLNNLFKQLSLVYIPFLGMCLSGFLCACVFMFNSLWIDYFDPQRDPGMRYDSLVELAPPKSGEVPAHYRIRLQDAAKIATPTEFAEYMAARQAVNEATEVFNHTSIGDDNFDSVDRALTEAKKERDNAFQKLKEPPVRAETDIHR